MHLNVKSWTMVLASLSMLLMLCDASTAAAQSRTTQTRSTAGGGYTPFAQQGRLGLGFGGSSIASGITGKYYLTNRSALQLAGGSWVGQGFAFSGDVIIEMPQLVKVDVLSMNWHAGAGAALFSSSETTLGIGVMGVLGLGFQLEPIPVELVMDIRPSFNVGLGYPFYFYGGGALRYFF